MVRGLGFRSLGGLDRLDGAHGFYAAVWSLTNGLIELNIVENS